MSASPPLEKKSTPLLSPRLVAVQVVVRVLRDGATLALPASSAALSRRDRALAVEISAGTVRHLTSLDLLLKSCMTRPSEKKHAFLWAVLRTALYQALYMRVPERAAVHEAVELIKSSREVGRRSRASLGGFVNGVLRSVLRLDRSVVFAKILDPVRRLSVEYAYPEWLVRRWWHSVGEEVTRQRVLAGNQVAPLTLRTNTLVTSREKLLSLLGAGARPSSLLSEGVLLDGSVAPVEKIPGYDEGFFAVQDQAAQLVSRFLSPRSGEALLDACAAPGGKTAHLAALATLHITAVEKDPERVGRLRENLQRLQVRDVDIVVGDAREAGLLGSQRFDRVLLDVPCTGTGVIRRHPEIKWRRTKDDLKRIAAVQEKILAAVAERVVAGGWLVYATCSLEPEENYTQVERFLRKNPEWRRVPIEREGVTIKAGDFYSEPGEQDMDGFYAARLQRRS